MRSWFSRQILGVVVGIAAGAFIAVPSTMAQNRSRPTVDQFLANPSQVLAQYPNGGAQLISLIRDVCLEKPSALSSIIGLLGNANSDQQRTIGSGLGQCAMSSARTNQAYANQIQEALAASGVQNAIVAFAGVTGNVQTASPGGGAGGGGAGGGGGVGSTGTSGFAFGGSNTGNSNPGSSSSQTSSQNYFTGGRSFGGASQTSGSGSGSVSPH